MVKKVSTISIDEDVLKLAKKEIPNFSGFVESCLRAYLGLTDNQEVYNMQEELNKIKQSQLYIHLLTKNEYENTELETYNKSKINDVWLKIWAVYRNNESIIDSEVFNASNVTGKSYDFLVDMMETLVLNIPKSELSFCDDWDFALQKYMELI